MAEPLRILVLEDNPTDVELIQFELQEAGLPFLMKAVMTEREFVREIEQSAPDIILSDYDLPRYNGASALAEARRRCPDTPFILVTGAVSEDRAIEILTQGAKDYVLKNRLQQRLVPAIRRALAEAEEQKARRKAEAELRDAHKKLEKRVRTSAADLDAEVAARKEMEEAIGEIRSRETAHVKALRGRAAERIKPGGTAAGSGDPGVHAQRLLQEFQIHQIELEMMNEELMRSKTETDLLLARQLEIYDFAPVGFFTLSPDGTILQANPAGAALLQVERSRLAGRQFLLRVADGYGPVFETFFRKAMEGEEVQDCEVMLLQAGGAARFVRLRARRSGNGKECHVGMTDITGRRQAEAALEQRTRQLENVNRELASFSFHAAHDLREPLRAIDGCSRMILEDRGLRFDEEARNRFHRIRSSAERMTRLTDALLNFHRVGTADPSITKLDMEGIFSAVWKELQCDHPDRVMTVDIDRLPPCMGDRSLIVQACRNLLHNAVKFTRPRESARIEIGGYLREKESVYHVRDNGVGFDMAFQEELFGVFQRLHGDEFDGAGIGLALVRRILNRLNGQVWAESRPNEGATFYFSLPAADAGG